MKPIEHKPVKGKYKTCRPSIREKQLIEKFDPLAGSAIENHAGLITRTAVEIARYNRTIANECTPEATEHYQRLIRTAEYLTQIRMLELATTDPEAASQVKSLIDSVEWPTVRPEVNFPVSYDGTEPAVTVTFKPFVPLSKRDATRHHLPA